MNRNFYKLHDDIASRRDLTATAKVVYSVIVSRIGDNGSCWPGVRTLAVECGTSVNAVRRAVEQLERAGVIVVHGAPSGKSNTYSLPTGTVSETDARSKRMRIQNGRGGVSETNTEAHPKRILNKKESLNKTQLLGHFDVFWKSYPRKVAKAAARKAWLKIKPSEELTEQIFQAVNVQSQSDQWQKDGGQYIPHPATWLNNGRWEDEVVGASSVVDDNPFDDKPESFWVAREAELEKSGAAEDYRRSAREQAGKETVA